MGALLNRQEGVGIDGVDCPKQLLDLILGKAHAQHMDVFTGIGAGAVPVGDAAAQGTRWMKWASSFWSSRVKISAWTLMFC